MFYCGLWVLFDNRNHQKPVVAFMYYVTVNYHWFLYSCFLGYGSFSIFKTIISLNGFNDRPESAFFNFDMLTTVVVGKNVTMISKNTVNLMWILLDRIDEEYFDTSIFVSSIRFFTSLMKYLLLHYQHTLHTHLHAQLTNSFILRNKWNYIRILLFDIPLRYQCKYVEISI